MTIFVGSHLTQILRIAYASDRPVLLRGRTGVGKSQMVEAASEELGIGFIVRDLSLMEPPDLVGMPTIKNKCTHFNPPIFLPKNGGGILLFEEINRAPRFMLAPMIELLTSRQLNDYKLPKGWLPMAAMNPHDDNDNVYTDTRPLDAALLARFMIIDVEPAVSDWVTWAKKNDIRADVIDFIRKTPDVFAATESNPRAWGYVSTVMNQLEKHQAKPDQMMNCITGLVGETMAVSYLSHRASKGSIKLTVQCLLTSYASCRAELKKLKQQNDTSRLHALVQEVLLYCQDPCNRGDQKHEQAKVAMLSQFAKDLPAEFRLRVNDFIPERSSNAE